MRFIQQGMILLALLGSLGIIFYAGWIMGQQHYQTEVNSLLEQGKIQEAFDLCIDWFHTKGDSPEYYDAMAEISLTQGQTKQALWNVRQARKKRCHHE